VLTLQGSKEHPTKLDQADLVESIPTLILYGTNPMKKNALVCVSKMN